VRRFGAADSSWSLGGAAVLSGRRVVITGPKDTKAPAAGVTGRIVSLGG
jgi:hypothetical protein